MSLKEKIDGNELDLSLNQLTEVPVKELAAATKATRLDISCNRIRSLPREFSSLTHLVKIDLSSNSLCELPENFGNLYNLQHLDLYSNQLTTLPVSFCRLKNLRWLDLKNNPLETKLKSIAGDCLDEKDCQACAKKVVAYMQALDSEMEREKQKKLKAAREKIAVEQAKIEKELEEQRKLKKLEREKRKADSKAKKEAEKLMETENSNDGAMEKETLKEVKQDSTKGNNFWKLLMWCMFAIFTTVFVSLLLVNNVKPSQSSAQDFKIFLQRGIIYIQTQSSEALQLIKHHFPTVKETILKIIHQYLILMTRFATFTEELLSQYFH